MHEFDDSITCERTNTVSQKITWCRIFATTSATVNQFWKFFHCWKRQ